MALIKNRQSSRMLKEAIVLDMGDLGRQADRLLASAREQARNIIEAAQAQATQLIEGAEEHGHKLGYERGYAEGHAAGETAGRDQALQQHAQQLQQLSHAWQDALQKWERDRENMLQDARDDVLKFAIQVAEKIVHRIVQTDPAVVRDQLDAALHLVGKPSAITITLHPDDRALAEQVMPDLIAAIPTCRHVDYREDASMLRGGCVLSTQAGRIDATIETQMLRIAEALVAEPAA